MTKEEAKIVLCYCEGSSEAVHTLREEQKRLVKGRGGKKRNQEIEETISVIKSDAETIRKAVDRLYGRYRGIIKQRYVYGYSWARIATYTGYPDSSIRYWHDRGLERLCEVMETVPDAAGILERATFARK